MASAVLSERFLRVCARGFCLKSSIPLKSGFQILAPIVPLKGPKNAVKWGKTGIFNLVQLTLYKAKFEEYAKEWEMLGDKVILYPCYDTLQVSDYSKFNMASFDESKKKLSHEKNFPEDLENAYQIGQELSKRRLQLAGTSMDFRMLSPESPFKGSSKFPLP